LQHHLHLLLEQQQYQFLLHFAHRGEFAVAAGDGLRQGVKASFYPVAGSTLFLLLSLPAVIFLMWLCSQPASLAL
jgi:hypothetical protein